MRKFYSMGIAVLFSLNISANDYCFDLEKRIGFYTVESYSKAVNDLERNFNGIYNPDSKWKDAINDLESNRNKYILGLRAKDKKTVKKVEQILDILDGVLLDNPLIRDKRIVAIKRYFDNNSRNVMSASLGIAPSNFQNNSEIRNPKTGWNNEFVSIVCSSDGIKQEVMYSPVKGMIISDPEPSFDGSRLMYSSIGTNDRWHLFEYDLKSGNVTQLTPEEYKDFDSFDGCYTPEGNYIFCSTGTFLGLPCTDGGNKMCGLFTYNPTTCKTRQLTFDQDSNWGPVILDNGTVLYQRWEYADLPHSNSRIIFTMNPDGTTQNSYYGSNSYFPTSFFNARPIPSSPTCIVGVASGHHGWSRSGRLMIIDTRKGRQEADGVVAEIPFSGKKVEPLIRDRFSTGIWPQFLQPYPLNENYFIVSMKDSEKSLWGIYLVDRFDNRTLIAESENAAFLEPVIMEARKTPAVIPNRVDISKNYATVFLQDVYHGGGLEGIPRGTVKKLRIGSYDFSPLKQGGLLGTIGMDGPWDIKRILGEVDVEEDGSAIFNIPANTPVFVQPLDEEGKALQVMRSWFTGMPGEMVSCIGCHEDKNSLPIPKVTIASRKKPQEIKEWYGRERGFSYRHEVQPILDKYCVSCHNSEDNADKPYLKGDKWISDWVSGISGRAGTKIGGHFTVSYVNLHRHVRRPGIESDIHMLVPMDVHADQTELMQMLIKGHHNVKLDDESYRKLSCWIDFNAPFHGRRTDIPNSKVTKLSYEMRALYSDMFGTPKRDTEWLPEIDENTTPVIPEKEEITIGETELENWPLYNPEKGEYDSWKKPQNIQTNLVNINKTIDLGNGIRLELVKIPSGKFIMGSDRNVDESPQCVVTIDKPFWMGRFEITNEQYRAFNPKHDSRDEHRHGYQFGRRGYSMNGDKQPVVRVSWQEAMNFCKWLSDKTGMKFSLPTEAQWEWACRAGSATPYWYGKENEDFTRFANLGDVKLKEFAACTAYKNYESVKIISTPNRYDDWIPRDTVFNDGGFISENVGSYIPNSWDLFDMHGNVWEWTLSSYKPYPYSDNDGRNDINMGDMKKVARGGSWYDRPKRATSTYRLPYRDYQKVYNVGFRVIMEE